ncbi:MAG: ABC transporter ATP-binding protein [Chloroflexota bacterium]
MTGEPAIVIQGLTKSYGAVRALRGVDLEVRRGEIFGFLGPNGAGKTTTIRCLLDLIRPNGGQARVLGIDPQIEPVKVRSRVGYLPGELRLDDNLTVEQLLRFLNQLRGGRADWGHVRRLTDRLDLDLRTPTQNLSKGNKQKVGVIQALMHRPELLLMDEPTFGLDPLMQQEVLRILAEAKADGTTVFFSSHILSEVQEVAERVGIIRAGVVVEVAETAALLHRSFRRARVRFARPIDLGPIEQVSGVQVIARDGLGVTLQVEGAMQGLIQALAGLPVVDLDTERPSLEEIFLAYYASERKEAA